jgi:hypothetical protein
MPSHLAHLAYAKQLYPRYLVGDPDGQVLIGTLFPDIRYVSKLHRAATHPAVVGRVQLWHSEGFHQGFLLHGAIDLAWDRMLHEQPEIFSGLEKPKYNAALKLAIDYYAWPALCDDFISACDEPLPYEHMRQYGVTDWAADSWYQMLTWYVAQPPTSARQQKMAMAMGMSEVAARELMVIVDQYLADPQTKRIAEQFANSLPQRLGLSKDVGDTGQGVSY